jgi:lipopolysaccharide biosynthesis protein
MTQDASTRPVDATQARVVAFYLPQFHTIPENDEWWGQGFTEWVNVRRAKPQYAGHDHPRIVGDLGEYDLTRDGIKDQQSALARSAGIDAFCMYFYWFNGRRLLEKPLDQWRDRPELLPYCVSWANEAWTRRWDGKEHDVLMPQTYDEGYENQFFKDVLPHLKAPHYLRVDDRPILVVHRADLIPQPRIFAARMREFATTADLSGLYLVAAETKPGIDATTLGFDAVAEFPPVGANTMSAAYLRPMKGVSPDFRGRLMSYRRLARRFQTRRSPKFVRHPGIMPGWDNTARRGPNATIYAGATPALFGAWAKTAIARETRARGSRGLVFINSWNEWAEGAYLEPDATSGSSYLEAMLGTPSTAEPSSPTHRWLWAVPQLMSLGRSAAGSALNMVRWLRSATQRMRTP